MNTPPIVSPEDWDAAREELLVKEKELTRARDALAAERRRMPWMAEEKDYEFEGPDGEASLLDLFDGRRQLVVYRFFFDPGMEEYPERGCGGCSFFADQVSHLAHLNARDVTLVFVSRAPQEEIQRLKSEMGWDMPWYTITDDFDVDHGVGEWHGTNAFIREGDEVFRTYFLNSRGTRRWARPGASSTSRRSGARRSGRTRRRVTRRRRHTSGGTTTTSTARRRHDRPRVRISARGAAAGDHGRVRGAAGACEGLAVNQGQTLTMERTFAAPAQRVFDAFTSEEVMRRWWHADHDWETPEARVDLRIGGEVRVVMRNPHDDAHYGGGGEYTEIDPPSRLAFTWTWDDDTDRLRQLIEIEFHEADGATTVRLTNSGLKDEESVASHEEGWGGSLDNLERELSS